VKHHLQVIRVAEIDEPPQVRQQEATKHRLGEERSSLTSEVVADEEDVDRGGGGIEDPLADLRVVVDDVLEQSVDELRLVDHLQAHGLHAEEIDQVVLDWESDVDQEEILEVSHKWITTQNFLTHRMDGLTKVGESSLTIEPVEEATDAGA